MIAYKKYDNSFVICVRLQHYYQTHLKQDLYFCKKCGQGFAHKSHKSVHVRSEAYPMKDQGDQFPCRAPFNEELEATFKRWVIMPLEITEGDVQQQQQQPDIGNLPEPRQSGAAMSGEVQQIEQIPIAPAPILPQLPPGMSKDATAGRGYTWTTFKRKCSVNSNGRR